MVLDKKAIACCFYVEMKRSMQKRQERRRRLSYICLPRPEKSIPTSSNSQANSRCCWLVYLKRQFGQHLHDTTAHLQCRHWWGIVGVQNTVGTGTIIHCGSGRGEEQLYDQATLLHNFSLTSTTLNMKPG